MNTSAYMTKAASARALKPGFTLIEIILTLLLVVLLGGMIVLSVGSYDRSRRLEEGASRVKSMLQMARAQSANMGKRMRLAFDQPAGAATLLIELDPLGAPGAFVQYADADWTSDFSTELVQIVGCRLTGASAYPLMASQESQGSSDQPSLEPITFYPDGSSDFAVLELSPANLSDQRRAVVELDGSTGSVVTRILGQQEFEEYKRQTQSGAQGGGAQ